MIKWEKQFSGVRHFYSFLILIMSSVTEQVTTFLDLSFSFPPGHPGTW